MKKVNFRNAIFIILGAILLLLIIVEIMYYFRNRRTYTLDLPQFENLKSISLNLNDKNVIVTDEEEMKDILSVLNNTKKVTKNESIQDAPVNVKDEIKLKFNLTKDEIFTIFVYTKNQKYYIEQPYNGIYQISGDEYNSIKKYIIIENSD